MTVDSSQSSNNSPDYAGDSLKSPGGGVAGVRLLLVDDHTMLREGLRRSLTEVGFVITAEAADGQQAIELTGLHHPQVILMDVTMPVLDGIEATRRIHQRHPEVKVVMLTMHAEPDLARRSADAGASGYLVKDCTTNELVDAIRRAMQGEFFFPATSDSPPESDQQRLLTQREQEILQIIANGATTSDTAATLYLSIKTVKNHLASAYAKLGAHDRTQAVLRAARLGLVELPHGD